LSQIHEIKNISGLRQLTHGLGMIREIAIANFKSIGREARLELRPLTLLFGRTGSGKSNILEAIWRLAQLIVIQWPIDRLYQIPPSYPSEEMIFHMRDTKRTLLIEFHVKPPEGELIKLNELAKPIGKKISEDDTIGWRITYGYSFGCSQGVFIDKNLIVEIKSACRDGRWERPVVCTPKGFEDVRVGDPMDLRSRIFSAVRDHPKNSEYKPFSDLGNRIAEIVKGHLADYKNRVSKVALLAPFRGKVPFRVVLKSEKSKGTPSEVGLEGENLMEILFLMAGSRRYRDNWVAVRRWARRLGVADLTAGPHERIEELGLDYLDTIFKTVLDVAMASHGMRQALTMIAQLFWPEQTVVLIEEPEISLHPEAVAMLPLMFYDAIRMGKQIIATTHSPILPLALSRMVERAREDGLIKDASELIAVYEVYKSPEGTRVKRLPLDEWGYIEGYVPSFFEVETELLKEWERRLPSG